MIWESGETWRIRLAASMPLIPGRLIWLKLLGLQYRLFSVCGLTDHVQSRIARKQRTNRPPDRRVVIHNQNTNYGHLTLRQR